MTNVLILTASVGNGHNQVALNLQHKLTAANCNVNTVDFLQASSYDLNNLFCNVYQRILQYKPDFFRSICHVSENNRLNNIKYLIGKMNRHIIHRLAKQYHPDCIVCTHFFPLAAAASCKEKYHLPFKLVGIVTDYTVHPVWQIDSVDTYFLAHPSLIGQFPVDFNPACQIIPTGIPVGTEFTPVYPPTISNNILIMTSNQTQQNISCLINTAVRLPSTISITFITGNNKQYYSQLKELSTYHKNFTVIGFTKHVAFYMKKCDLLITKPGGATLSEALAVGIPLIISSPIPGIEEANARFIETNGLGFWAHETAQLPALIKDLLHNPDKRRLIRQKMLNLKISGAAEKIQQELLGRLLKKDKVA
ncbi:MGDG synthase family glycosyltransferase [Pectinatus frisingensis]|jgi:processive 1,2-diacylglycerol beta-glucosyltransferase|uniref:MGDG synthase family glycosyltransferase n=1 Tax=Pectinatus frisingensis TaxID=865 RepID=UPI0015F71B45|nr:glycosyltransferase [Pectinatus frisingensis]